MRQKLPQLVSGITKPRSQTAHLIRVDRLHVKGQATSFLSHSMTTGDALVGVERPHGVNEVVAFVAQFVKKVAQVVG